MIRSLLTGMVLFCLVLTANAQKKLKSALEYVPDIPGSIANVAELETRYQNNQDQAVHPLLDSLKEMTDQNRADLMGGAAPTSPAEAMALATSMQTAGGEAIMQATQDTKETADADQAFMSRLDSTVKATDDDIAKQLESISKARDKELNGCPMLRGEGGDFPDPKCSDPINRKADGDRVTLANSYLASMKPIWNQFRTEAKTYLEERDKRISAALAKVSDNKYLSLQYQGLRVAAYTVITEMLQRCEDITETAYKSSVPVYHTN